MEVILVYQGVKLIHLQLSYREFSLKQLLDIDLTPYQTTFLHWTKFKAFADKKFHVAQKIISVFNTIENIVGQGENADYQRVLFFPQCFQKIISSGS